MRISDWSSDVCSSDLICGDVLHSRVARSNIICLSTLGAQVRVIAPPTLMPEAIEQMSATAFTDFDEGLEGADVVMMLRLQHERMDGAFIPSPREYHMLSGLTPADRKSTRLNSSH